MNDFSTGQQRLKLLKSSGVDFDMTSKENAELKQQITKFDLAFKETGNRLYRMETKQNHMYKNFLSKSDAINVYRKIIAVAVIFTLANTALWYMMQKYVNL